MAQFFKTFLVCLVLVFGLLGYRYFNQNSFNKDLSVNSNSVFGVHSDNKKPDNENNQSNSTLIPNNYPSSTNTPSSRPAVQKYNHTCYFYSQNGVLVPVEREVGVQQNLEGAIAILLKGPTIKEAKKGIYSEIPGNVDLISVKRDSNSIIIDLTSAFEEGGGSNSIENRVKQLSKTVKAIEPKKNIYLNIEGKRVEYLGGEGVYIKQPLN